MNKDHPWAANQFVLIFNIASECTSFPPKTKKINKQLLDEVEHDIMNYQNRGLCYLPKPKADIAVYDVKFTSYCELIKCSRPIRFFIVSLMYNNKD